MTAHRSVTITSVVLAVLTIGLGGCVDRRIFITSEPSGALVYLNDSEVGRTPLEVNFTYFGVYDVRLRKQGFEPLLTSAKAKPPLHELPVIDFFALFIPVTKRTHIDWHFTLEPIDLDEDALLERATVLKEQFDNSDEGS